MWLLHLCVSVGLFPPPPCLSPFQEYSIDSVHYQFSNPPLNGVTRGVQNVQTVWQVGTSRYLCLSTLVKNPASLHWEQNGRKLSARTVKADDLCVDCNSEQCIRQAERLHGDQKGRGGAEVLQVTWSDSCAADSGSMQMMSLLWVRNVSMETTGVYAFQAGLRLIQYNVTVGKSSTHPTCSRISWHSIGYTPASVTYVHAYVCTDTACTWLIGPTSPVNCISAQIKRLKLAGYSIRSQSLLHLPLIWCEHIWLTASDPFQFISL